MKIVVTGASGFIGSALCAQLLRDGHLLTLLTYSAPHERQRENKRWLHWTPGVGGQWENALDGCDAVINLAGAPIAARRWTNRHKRRIRSSRVDATSSLIAAITRASRKPKCLISGSAVGFYGNRGAETLTEASPAGNDFLARVCYDWEAEAYKAESLGCRVVLLRTGIVLGRDGGALQSIGRPFKFLVGGPLGSGKQWMSWIHIQDEIGIIRLLLENPSVRGPVNATAPNPVTNNEFSKILGRVMRRPSWLGAPAFALRIALGEMADMLLAGQRVIPAVAQEFGYQFRFANLRPALEECLRRGKGRVAIDEQ